MCIARQRYSNRLKTKTVTRQTLSLLALVGSLLLSGCGREEVSTYRVPKQAAKPTPTHDHQDAAAPAPQNWKVPTGWQATTPGPMVLASYNISAKEGSPTVTVSMFPGDVGGVLANVNRWRGQLGQPITTEADLPKLIQPIELPHAQGTLVDFVGTNSKTSQPARMIGVIVPRDGNSWFYKMTGDTETVAAEKSRFIEFIGHAH